MTVAPQRGTTTRPPFADAYPTDPELDALLSAFQAGDYALVRKRAPELAARAADSAVSNAARDLRARLDPDPLARYMLGVTLALLAFLTAWFLWHGHA